MHTLFARHQQTLAAALKAAQERGYWSAYPEVPSGKIYGETAKDDGLSSYNARLGRPFDLPGHPATATVGTEVSPFGPPLGITYPAVDAITLVEASRTAAPAWAAASAETRVGICLEILARLNRISFEMANAVMHTTGQAFAMAFQAGGPHAQDRGLEALAYAFQEMTRTPAQAVWTKPQGIAEPIVLEKHWRIVPRGVSLVIGCQTFPTWNSYPGLFASLATGNTVIVKPHPGAILPLAITVSVIRQVLSQEGFAADVALLAADAPGAEITRDLVENDAVSIIDYTGSNSFGDWLRRHAGEAPLYTEEAGVNSIVVAATDDFAGMCANIAFSLCLYSGQMCTAPQNIYVPRNGIETNQGHKSFDDVAGGIVAAIDDLVADPARAAGVCGAIANPATLARIATARGLGTIIRDSAPINAGDARTATPLVLAVDADKTDAHEEERFGPIAFIVGVADADDGIAKAATLARRKGAITAALYDTNDNRTDAAVDAFAKAGVNLSINLTGGIFVNQSAAFSDFHVTGANPAGNASLTDTAFVANRFRIVMWRRPKAA
ncbi:MULTISPECIES: phenylacetic acid degradation protein PaaN [Rhizobium]|uniref:Phenylacetic acid degradation protein paaN n=1 Tax=Rhizobium favelukesii TaxID=348824 RepID=W6RLD1_9HYPH|nr:MULTISPECIES: phenylacetic acid degradation protein PaaN [Rhizobium]MCA0804717.1 phenylacetic acid degradation protein PaaN [Rhizobium sp. T1473]MCS0457992.1 phenylacetic acid degradation protein PaaN [Rhizobium favelukesii]UFS79901.1 phenylacetic acid degradation protein PaaN [Rhizobium sp. T136]CDM61614.1 phenylacetic acid degradation protein paaN [Rhizobium favelukesii]